MRILVLIWVGWLLWNSCASGIGAVIYCWVMARHSYRLQVEPEALFDTEEAQSAYVLATSLSRILAALPAGWLLSILW